MSTQTESASRVTSAQEWEKYGLLIDKTFRKKGVEYGVSYKVISCHPQFLLFNGNIGATDQICARFYIESRDTKEQVTPPEQTIAAILGRGSPHNSGPVRERYIDAAEFVRDYEESE